ncbi:hypothetical protein FA13DRAFT_1789870 [Coprinellus micaceus]|uniref:DUF7918 domain-containing protein n=1 Tax=Coprinellus micaceus TaxID=71717 RepID=A0A4Y7THH3_COPMI|nr:hypothetical protein FA13DRAFT_1789870 [Coprinellus micaceus]
MPKSPQGYELWIEVEGERVEEFQIEATEGGDGPRTTCWIPCEAGKAFSIVVSIPAQQMAEDHHQLDVRIDGEPITISGNLLKKAEVQSAYTKRYHGAYHREKETIRPFQFGTLDLTDDEAYLGATSKGFGEITLTLNTVEILGIMDTEKDPQQIDPTEDFPFGEEQPCKRVPYYKLTGWKAVSTLVFNYRQMDMLVAKGIAPSRASAKQPEPHHDTPAPTGSRERVDGRNGLPKGKRKSDSVKEEGEGSGFENPIDVEIQSLRARLVALEAEKEKQPNYSDPTRPAKRVKLEPQSTLVPGETIDLTMDVKTEPRWKPVPGEIIDLTV